MNALRPYMRRSLLSHLTRKMITRRSARNQTNLARVRMVLTSPLFGFARTQTHTLTLWTVTDEDRVRRSRLMTAVTAMQNVAYLPQQFELVSLYTIGTARAIHRHRFPQTVPGTNSGHDADRQDIAPAFTGCCYCGESTPKLEECKPLRPLAL